MKLFLIDTAVLLGILLSFFFIYVIVKAIQNGRDHKITDENIFTYCLKAYPASLGKRLKNILSWALLLFIIQVVYNLFGALTRFIKMEGSYDTNPLLAFLVDAFEAIVPAVTPFLIPSIIIIAVIVLGYGLIMTLHQIYKNEMEHEKMLQFVSAENNNSSLDTDRKHHPYKPSKKELLFYFSENSQKGFFKIAKFLPKFLIIIAICIGINSLFLSIRNVTTIINNQKKIQELHITVKNLSNSEGLARITLLKEENPDSQYPIKTYKIEILSDSGEPIPSQTQNVVLKGKEIFIDAININFEYSEIAQGEKFNIAYPYRVYSETMVPSDGFPLECMYKDGSSYPVIYCLENSEIYGLPENVFYNRLMEIFDIIKDQSLSREMGIRSIIGVANHFEMKENEVRDMFIEGTGGVSIKKHETL